MLKKSRRDLLKAGSVLTVSAATANALPSFIHAADPYEDAVLLDGVPDSIEPGSFTIAVLPDTQNYSEHFPETFLAQTKWIAENQYARNISCVLHLGDITNRSSRGEWENAKKAMSQLDGKIPYFLVNGNHDYSAGGSCSDRTTLLNDYFSIEQFKNQSTFGGAYDREPNRMENTFHLFSVGSRKFLVLALEFGPRKDVIRWANNIASKYHDREAILITHVYMYHDETRYDWKSKGEKQSWNPHSYPLTNIENDVSDGQELWDELVSKHENFILTLNGHVLNDGLGRLTSLTPGGREVHQMLVNFQMKPKGGDGWLRLLEFKKSSTEVSVVDFSPTRMQVNHSTQNRFSLKLSPIG